MTTNGTNGQASGAPTILGFDAAKVAALKTTRSVDPRDVQIAKLMTQVEALKKQVPKPEAKAIEIKVGAKGGIQISGLGRFPFTPYAYQMMRILQAGERIKAFIIENWDKLNFKTEEQAKVVKDWLMAETGDATLGVLSTEYGPSPEQLEADAAGEVADEVASELAEDEVGQDEL